MSAARRLSTRYLTPPTKLSGSQILTRFEIMRTRWRSSWPSASLSSLLLSPTDSYPVVCSRKGFVSSRKALSFLPFPLVGIYVLSHQVNLFCHDAVTFKQVFDLTTGVGNITMVSIKHLTQFLHLVPLLACKVDRTLACQ